MHPTVRGRIAIDHTDASEVGARLTELLPFDNEMKQSFFEMQDPNDSMSLNLKSQTSNSGRRLISGSHHNRDYRGHMDYRHRPIEHQQLERS